MGLLFDMIKQMNAERDESRKREIAQRLVSGVRDRINDPLVSDFFERRLNERHEDWDSGSVS